MIRFLKKESAEFQLLLHAVPTVTLIAFVLSVVAMNLLANKSLSLPISFLALDSGILVSWLPFLIMDVVTKHFGPKAATQLSVFAILVNLLFCLLFFVASRMPGMWGEAFVPGSEQIVNTALDHTFGGTWYVLLGSTAAFLTSSLINNFSNDALGKVFRHHPESMAAFIIRTYVSTAVGQFADNLVFALLVSHLFFGWTLLQCVTCALTGMLVELCCEFVFCLYGFRICDRWKARNVGQAYFAKREETP